MSKYTITWGNKNYTTNSMIDAACKYIIRSLTGDYTTAMIDDQMYKQCNIVEEEKEVQFDDLMISGDNIILEELEIVKYIVAYMTPEGKKSKTFDVMTDASQAYHQLVKLNKVCYIAKSVNDGPAKLIEKHDKEN